MTSVDGRLLWGTQTLNSRQRYVPFQGLVIVTATTGVRESHGG